MVFRSTVVAAIVIYLLAASPPIWADNVNPKAANPQEHAAMMELTAAQRYLHGSFKPIAVEKLQKLANERPDWEFNAQVELDLAHSQMNNRDYEKCLNSCERLKSKYRDSKPDIAVSAQYYKAACLSRMTKYPEAVAACNEMATYTGNLGDGDLSAILQAQRKLAELIWLKKLDSSKLFNFAPGDVNGQVWMHSVMMAKHAMRGDLEDAYQEYQEIKGMLPAGDKRLALAGLRLLSSELDAYERSATKYPSALTHANQLMQELESAYPSQAWLLTRGKLVLAASMIRQRVELAEAQKLCQDVVNQGAIPNLMPQAYSLLAETYYAQEDFTKAAQLAGVVAEKYPYSTWADFATFMCADSLYKAGSKAAAAAKLDQLMKEYPDSGWVEAAKVMKEVTWK